MAISRRFGIPVILGSAVVFIFSTFNAEPANENTLNKTLALDLLNQLSIQEENREGYERELFMDNWSDLDADGCDTRREVLFQESLTSVIVEEDCKIISGEWISTYDGIITKEPAEFDIDHFVPLAEAWDSGASLWNDEERKLFAEDLIDADSLIAVSRQSNRNKGDRDPAEWLPILPETHCWYVTTWISIKHRWRLSVDQKEFEAIRETLTLC